MVQAVVDFLDHGVLVRRGVLISAVVVAAVGDVGAGVAAASAFMRGGWKLKPTLIGG
jgi:hypothetical protein